ncbi:HlyD family efflux transporter periplasmic adaptor subunit [Tropicimonas sp. IMCC6043]|uniref:HlyD family efflux transporter periplasmic adaptor subunit n=1 Tax=Tropicimonas sp. IMCC6043 TaxID=2510645 RepID=UPI00101E0F21|nr:HlyD family efflux transporter periplasmic adaptor subunit [Tropicimonas sp. IMCC6043]RYH07600.1 HlyD family efflux transporter periplasmic adaptor subunit [Tropicimonas sp. IMCC6043]
MLKKVDPGAPPLPLEVQLPKKMARACSKWAGKLLVLAVVATAFVTGGVFATVREPEAFAGLADLVDGAAGTLPAQSEAIIPIAEASRPVLGLARLMPDGDLIRVSPPFGAADARIAEILVSEGDRVATGDLLAVLDNRPALESARLAAKAAVVQREAALAQSRETVRIGLLEARASVGEAEAATQIAETRLARARALAERGVTTAATLDDLQAAAAQAAQGLARARATLARWDTGEIGTHPDIVIAQAASDAARIDLERAARDLARSEVRAPISGVVLEIDSRPGERPGSDGLMTLGQTERMVARVEIYQTEIGRVREAQPVRLTAAPLDTPLTGQVERIGLVVGRQNLVSDDAAANTDARVIEVLVRLDADSSARAARLSNLEAVAHIEIEGAL